MQLINVTSTHFIFLKNGNTYSFRHGLQLTGPVEYDAETNEITHADGVIVVAQEMVDAALTPPPPPPPPVLSAEESLARAKAESLARAKIDRDNALAGGFEFAGVHYQTRNDKDVINITGVGLAAIAANAAGQPFSVDFRATDNTVQTMDGPTASAFYLTMVSEAQAIWASYNSLYQSIVTAQTVEELEAL